MFSVQWFSVQEGEDDTKLKGSIELVCIQLISKPLQGMYPHDKRPVEITGETLVRQKYGGLAGVRAPVDSTGGIIPPEL